jgi:hypothetical protein
MNSPNIEGLDLVLQDQIHTTCHSPDGDDTHEEVHGDADPQFEI